MYLKIVYPQDGDGSRRAQSTRSGTMDDKGNCYKSSVEVEHALREQGLLMDVSEVEKETETGGETSNFELTSVKRPRTSEV